MSHDSRMVFRVDYSVKQAFIRKAEELGYPNASECLRDTVETIVFNGERTPKEKVLAHHLSRFQNIMSAEQAEKVWKDFCRFMEEYRYAIYTTRLTEEEFIQEFNVYEPEADFMMQYCHMHGYSLLPVEITELLRHYYHDAEALQLRRQLITNVTKAHAEMADWQTLATPAEKEKIAKTTTL